MGNRQPFLSLLAVALVWGAASSSAGQPAWVSRGPNDIGYVNDIAAADGVAFAGTAGGIYRSTPSGDGWELAGLQDKFVWSIAARPGSPVYAFVLQSGLFVSRDGGDSWDRLAPDDSGLSAIAIDPNEPGAAYLGSNSGALWRTTDAGASWKRLPATHLSSISSLRFDPHEDALVISGYDERSIPALLRSTDGGMTLAPVSINGSISTYGVPIGSGEVSGNLYASVDRSFCRTANGGASWTCTPNVGYFMRVVEAPAPNAPPVLVGTTSEGVQVSTDGGATWTRASGPLASPFLQAVAVDASASVLVGTDEGIYRSTDRGATWHWRGSGLRSAVISTIAVDPADSSNILASGVSLSGTPGSGQGLFRWSDANLSWSRLTGPTVQSGFNSLIFDPGHGSTLFGAANGSIYKSTDAGASWTTLHANGYPRLIAADPRTPANIWASLGAGLSHSADGGVTWQNAGITQEIYSLAFDSHDPATLYAGSYYDVSYGYYAYPEGGSIFISRDLGATWTKNDTDLGAPLVALAADPFVGGLVYAGTSAGGVLRSVDGGRTWVRLTGPRHVAEIVADPVRPGHLYVNANGTVFRSRDGGEHWEEFADGLVAQYINKLAIPPDGSRLLAATSGQGIFEIDLEGVVAPSFPCVPAVGRLCLVGGRYALDLLALARGSWSAGAAHALNDRAGYFGFAAATGDAAFPEVVVKMLPEGALDPDQPGLFHASLTTLPYALTLTDTVTGRQQVYSGNRLCGGADLPFGNAEVETAAPKAGEAPGEATLSLLGNRFSVALHARNPRTGRESTGLAVASGDRWGYFSMPDVTGDPVLPEVVVKMVDFSAITGKFWFFHTGLTGFDYTLTVTDTATGAVRTYESPSPFCGGADTEAFGD